MYINIEGGKILMEKRYNYGDIIRFSNGNSYFIFSSVIYDDTNFLFMLDCNGSTQNYIGVVDENDYRKVEKLDTMAEENRELLKELFMLFTNDIRGEN